MENAFKFNVLENKPIQKIEINFKEGFVKEFIAVFEDGTIAPLICNKQQEADGIEIKFAKK